MKLDSSAFQLEVKYLYSGLLVPIIFSSEIDVLETQA